MILHVIAVMCSGLVIHKGTKRSQQGHRPEDVKKQKQINPE